MLGRVDDARRGWLALQRELGQRLSVKLFDEVRGRPLDRAGMSWSLALAFLIATGVYAIGAVAGIVGVGLLLGPWSNLMVVFGGATLVLMCWIARPRTSEPPHYLISRAQSPVLYALSDRMAAKMGAPVLRGIGVSAEFNANYRSASWRGHRYMELGSLLFAVLTPQERVAIIAHELSHGANGDPLRGQFLFGAVDTLSEWAVSLRPVSIGNAGAGMSAGPFISLAAIPLEYALLGLSKAMFLIIEGVLLLVMRDAQRAEYRADQLAATVAGTAAMQSALEKLYLSDTVRAALRTHSLTSPEAPFGPRLQQAVAALDAQQLEAYRAESRASNWQVDATHPPTVMRIEMLSQGPPHPPMALLSDAEAEALAVEFERMIASTQNEVMNRQREAINEGR
jgi:Zn-dependent protease with chaperone function